MKTLLIAVTLFVFSTTGCVPILKAMFIPPDSYSGGRTNPRGEVIVECRRGCDHTHKK